MASDFTFEMLGLEKKYFIYRAMMTSATFICMGNILVEYLRNVGIVIWGIHRKDGSNSFVRIRFLK